MKKEMQLLGFIIIPLLLVSLFIGCISEKKAEKEQAEYLESLPEDWKVYENKEIGFRLAYPPDWETNTEPHFVEDGFVMSFRKNGHTFGIILDFFNESRKKDFERGIEILLDACDEVRNITLGGVPAKEGVITDYIPEMNRKVGEVQILFLRSNESWVVHFHYYPESFREQSYKVLETFEFIRREK
jgi:hypothetical protein